MRRDVRRLTFQVIHLLLTIVVFVSAWIPQAWAQPEPRYSAEAIAHTIAAWTDEYECGRYCTEERREGTEDRSDYVVTPEDIWEMAEAMEAATLAYDDVSAEILIGVAWHESNMQRYAVGPGGECGVYQQIPRYVRPVELRETLGHDYDVICDYLQDIDQAVEAFASNASRWIASEGEEWLCHYNQGHSGCNAEGLEYLYATSRVIDRAHHNLRHFRRLEQAGELPSLLPQELTARAETIGTTSEIIHAAIDRGSGASEASLDAKIPSG